MGRTFSSVGTEPANAPPKYYKALTKRKLPTLHAVDGNNWACRAYYAMQQRTDLVSREGQTVFGVHCFVLMMKTFMYNVIKYGSKQEQFFAMCFDPDSDSTWRYAAQKLWYEQNTSYGDEVFSGKSSPLYKGTRDRTKTPDLKPQIDLIRLVLEANGFKVVRKSPYEGDDLIGTLSHMFKPYMFVDMYSVDKDYLQLIDDSNVRLIMQEQKNRPAQVYTVKNVDQHFGVPSSLIVDFLAMSGDDADNVPGIRGVAGKTAAALLNQWGSYDALRENIGKVKGKSRWKQAIAGELPLMDMELQRELVTIDRNVPKLPKDINAYARGPKDTALLKSLKKELRIDVSI